MNRRARSACLPKHKALPVAVVAHPNEHASHAPEIHGTAGLLAFGTALAGFTLAAVFYGWRKADPDEVRRFFAPVYKFFINKWYFDELYNALFVQPAMFISRRIADFDRKVIDRLIDGCSRGRDRAGASSTT